MNRFLHLLLLLISISCKAFIPSHTKTKPFELNLNRKAFLETTGATAAAFLLSQPANALVKGNAPPPPKKSSEEKKCTNVELCQEMAEKKAAEKANEEAAGTAASVTSKGTRYRNLSEGTSTKTVQDGDEVVIKYKVLKLGKRSYDGLSGEGTVVFSRGYGLEDDEINNPKSPKTFSFRVGSPNVITALSDGIQGMTPSSTRRISILPQMGWRIPTKACDGGPGGSGAGGDLKTDYVVVPTATMVAEEACFDKGKLPFPTNYAEVRRMAQRFDQSLIIEVELVDIL